MEITWNEFIEFAKNAIWVLGLLGFGVEVSPIKISPIGWLGKRFNKGIKDELKILDNRLIEIEKGQTKNKRGHIIDFANALKQGRHMSENAFQNVFKDIDDYKKEIKILKIPNGYIEAEEVYIKTMYQKMSIEGTILGFDDELNEY